MELHPELLGKCGFYCGSCPTYLSGDCRGCMEENRPGDCFTRDCVMAAGLNFCGKCTKFPCDSILKRPHTTILDRDWLAWKKRSKAERQPPV